MTPFATGFTEALRASLPAEHRDAPLAPATLERIIADCAGALGSELWGNIAGHGRVFWVERDEGFTDFAGDRLAFLKSLFPPVVPTLSDDGLIMLREVGE